MLELLTRGTGCQKKSIARKKGLSVKSGNVVGSSHMLPRGFKDNVQDNELFHH